MWAVHSGIDLISMMEYKEGWVTNGCQMEWKRLLLSTKGFEIVSNFSRNNRFSIKMTKKVVQKCHELTWNGLKMTRNDFKCLKNGWKCTQSKMSEVSCMSAKPKQSSKFIDSESFKFEIELF